ncbi:hypothetical protein, partial [Peribacillus simplex]|uniref:hypothetical protein n=1 Tax=Peribacillus simplex TaxID=1478 RepID=UPI0019D64ABE
NLEKVLVFLQQNNKYLWAYTYQRNIKIILPREIGQYIFLIFSLLINHPLNLIKIYPTIAKPIAPLRLTPKYLE